MVDNKKTEEERWWMRRVWEKKKLDTKQCSVVLQPFICKLVKQRI